MTDTLAIDGGKAAYTAEQQVWPVHTVREEELILEVLRSGNWSELTGDKVQQFNQAFARFQGAEYGVSVPNGTLALEVGLQALGVGPGDEIITTTYTFIATASSAFAVGAKPVFVDIDPHTNNIDPEKIEAAITTRTKAIVPVHIAGSPCDMDAILEISKKHGIPVLEDACQAWGSAWKGQPVGAIGDCGSFSFQASKNITAGEGGITITNDRDLYGMLWSVHNVGRLPEGEWYQHDNLGKNLRMTEWQGAILLAQLERLPEHIQRRHESAEILNEGVRGIPGLTPMHVDERTTGHSWHLYQLKYEPSKFGGRSRDEFLRAFQAEGVTSSGGYVPLNYQKAIRDTLKKHFDEDAINEVPHAEEAGRSTIWIPQTVLLGDNDAIQQIVEAAHKIQRVWA